MSLCVGLPVISWWYLVDCNDCVLIPHGLCLGIPKASFLVMQVRFKINRKASSCSLGQSKPNPPSKIRDRITGEMIICSEVRVLPVDVLVHVLSVTPPWIINFKK